MRIVAGALKGKRFDPPRGFRGRPTTDFAREALFNVLTNRMSFEGISMCDLFAGSGAMGFESFSRGASRVVAVESHGASAASVNKYMTEFGMTHSVVHRADVFEFLRKTTERFALVIADPPFDLPHYEDLVTAVMQHRTLLAPDGIFVVEHGPDRHFDTWPGFDAGRKYGHVHFSFFRPSQA
jgi:16S rRNA (guanine966-N2)-methyltransferase